MHNVQRAQKNPRGQRCYRCSGQIDWTNGCSQRMVNADDIETRLADFLVSMDLPENWEKDAVNAAGKLMGQERLEERIAEIRKIIERIDLRWDMGFMKQEELKAQLAEQLALELKDASMKMPHETLSDREFQVMRLFAAGKKSGEIAEQLSVSVNTVSTYRMRVLQKTKMQSDVELSRYAVEHGLID